MLLSGWAVLLLSWCVAGAGSLKSDDPVAQIPIDIGGRKQLLVDNMLLASVQGASFKTWVPQKRSMGTRPLIAPDSPWERKADMFMPLYASVLPRDSTPDGAPGDFQVWYWLLSHKLDSKKNPELSEQNGVTGYAEISADLSNVTKPILHQHDWMNDTDANNFLAGLSDGWQGSEGAREGVSVWKDPKRSLGGLYVSQAKLAKGSEYGLALSTSEDGVTGWKDVVRLENGPFDTQTVGLYDEENSQYALFTRGCTHDTAAEKVLGYRCVRKLASCPGMFHSSTGLKSLETCRNESIAMQTDALDNATHTPEDHTCTPAHGGHAAKCNMPTLDYYGGLVWQYEGIYWMFPQRTWHWAARKYPHSGNGTPIEPEPSMYAPAMIDVGLAYSRDGIHFTHLGGREPFLRPGTAGDFDSKMIWALPSPAKNRGPNRDQIWFFYAGTNTDHNGDVDAFSRTGGSQSGIDVAFLRLDGFSSLSARLHSTSGTGAAVAVTHPLRFNGSRLELNVRTGGGGSVTVELQDGLSGQPIAGFSDADCIPMVVDAVNATVMWAATSTVQPRADVSSLTSRAGGVIVKFTLVGADLYAFQFVV